MMHLSQHFSIVFLLVFGAEIAFSSPTQLTRRQRTVNDDLQLKGNCNSIKLLDTGINSSSIQADCVPINPDQIDKVSNIDIDQCLANVNGQLQYQVEYDKILWISG